MKNVEDTNSQDILSEKKSYIKSITNSKFLMTLIRHNKHNRKGVVDVQFNWIFVMIAGFVIFLFIISIALSQKHNAENQMSIDVMNQITTLLNGKQQTPNMYSEISFTRADVVFTCDPSFNLFSFKIANAQPIMLPVDMIFAPKQVNTNKLLVWSQPFTLGFPVGVFTYVTTPDAIILIYNKSATSTYANELFTDLNITSNISHEYMTDENDYSNFARRTIVCFNDDANPPSNSCPIAQNYDYIKISPAAPASSSVTSLFDYGTVTFHKKGSTNADKSSPYITKAGLYGAIFSNSNDFYKCQMSRALTQFEIKRELMQTRMILIQNDLPDESDCRVTINETLESEIMSMQNPVLSPIDITNLYTQSNQLDIKNTYLALYSCPKLY